MASRRLPIALLWPAGLVLLMGVLAFFQYKWLGQVSESERAQLKSTLNQRAREFADDFDREISGAYTALSISDQTVQARDWEAVATRYDQWKASARFPRLIRNIYLTGGVEAGDLLQFDPGARTFLLATWPAELDAVKERLRPLSGVATSQTSTHAPPPALPGAIRFVSLAATTVIADVPAILAPVQTTQRIIQINGGMPLPAPQSPRFVVIELDRAFMQSTMVASLVERHFSVDDYHVAVADRRSPDTPFFTKGVQSPSAIQAKDADASIEFFGLHVDVVKEALATLRPAGTTAVAGFPVAPTAPAAMLSATPSGRFSIVVQESSSFAATNAGVRTTNVQYSNGGAWQIVLQHPAGSLEAAVTKARRRNLSLSFGVLAVLAAGVFLISINAQRAQHLAAQQMDFVATVSHELRTPLAVIRSAAQNLSAGVVHEPAQAKRYGDLIDAEGRRLTDMVEQVLTYAGMSDGKRAATTAPTDIVTVTRDVVASCDGLIREAGFTVDVQAPETMADVPLDEAAYRRALNNLIGNALKYGTDGRWLGVSVTMATSKIGAPEVQVAVSDRGRGIDAVDLPHIFEAFYRGADAKERQIHGNGLGLSLVKGIAEAHGGRVTVKSSPGEGATFTLHLPA